MALGVVRGGGGTVWRDGESEREIDLTDQLDTLIAMDSRHSMGGKNNFIPSFLIKAVTLSVPISVGAISNFPVILRPPQSC